MLFLGGIVIHWVWAILASLLLVANAQGDEQHLLKNVSYGLTESGFQLELRFDRPYPEKKASIELINHTVQVNLPGGYYKPGKFLQKVKDKKIRSIFTYQANQKLLRSRIIYFPDHPVKNLAGLVQIKSKGNTLLVRLQDSSRSVAQMPTKKLPIVLPTDLSGTLEKALSQIVPKEVDVLENTQVSAEDIIKKDMNFSSTLPKKKKSKAESEIPVLTKNKTEKLSSDSSSIYWRAGLSLLVILIFAGALVVGVKYWTRNRIGVQSQTKIRLLTQHHLGPKKSLAIIQVAGESILIGVTDQSINLIKTLSLLDDEVPDETPRSFSGELERVEAEVPFPDTKVQDQVSLQAQAEISKPLAEELSYGKIQSQVEGRLKEMRSL